MSILKKKVASRRGASITFALLLFLVCAVVSSVVIVAGTAAAGRMSRMAEMDQRYYAVTSAAKAIQGIMENEAVTVVVETIDTYNYDPATKTRQLTEDSPVESTVVISNGSEIYKKIYKKGRDEIEGLPQLTIASDAALMLVDQNDNSSVDVLINDENLELVVDGLDELSVSIKEKLYKNGRLTLTVSNEDTDKGTYSLELGFAKRGHGKIENTQEVIDETNNKVTITTTKTWTFQWHLIDVRRISTKTT